MNFLYYFGLWLLTFIIEFLIMISATMPFIALLLYLQVNQNLIFWVSLPYAYLIYLYIRYNHRFEVDQKLKQSIQQTFASKE